MHGTKTHSFSCLESCVLSCDGHQLLSMYVCVVCLHFQNFFLEQRGVDRFPSLKFQDNYNYLQLVLSLFHDCFHLLERKQHKYDIKTAFFHLFVNWVPSSSGVVASPTLA